jgi:hypothetical protein
VSYDFQTITIKDFGGGIDQKSSENAIKPSYSERLENVVTNSNGTLSKRPGYEGYFGWLPLRVKSVQKTSGSTDIKIFFDSAVSLRNIVPTPVIIYGRLSVASIADGDFQTASEYGHYYSTFDNAIPYEFTAPSGNTGGINSVASVNVMTAVLKNTVSGTSSNELFLTDRIEVTTLGANEIDYHWSGLASSIEVYTPSEAIPATAGDYYTWNYTTTSNPETKTLAAATHQLSNFTPIVQFYYLSGTDWLQFIPDAFSINNTTGLVSITTSLPASIDVKVQFMAVGVDNTKTGTVTGSGSITFSTEVDFYFMTVYDINGNYVIPNGVVRDSSADTLAFNFSGIVGTQTFTCVYAEADTQANFLVITDTTGYSAQTYTDNAPQLTLWGIPHEDIYFNTNTTAGKVHHIDAYRAEAEERIITGISGVEYAARTESELSTQYQVGSTSVDLDARSAGAVVIGPAFAVDTETSVRTAGMLLDSSVESNLATVTGVSYVSSGVARYQLTFTSPTGTLSGCIVTTSGIEDYLTVTKMANSVNNGTFKIVAVNNANYTIDVENDYIQSTRFDETGALGKAGVFTDIFTAQANSNFLADDIATISSTQSFTILGSSGTSVQVKDLDDYIEMSTGFKIYGSRTTDVIPVESTDDIVRGDMITLTGFDRKFRVLNINSASNNTITAVTWSGTEATITLTSANTGLEVGKKVNILRTSDVDLNGTHTIIEVPSTTSFVVETGYTGSTLGNGGVLQGKTIQIDEEVAIYDAGEPMSVAVVGRWIPIEAPSSSYDLVSNAHYQYFTAGDYTSQDTTRSTIINDNMYFTNYEDAVMKFDGTSIYRAGLPYWQPQHMASVSDLPTSIALSGVLTAITARTNNRFTVAIGTQSIFQIGDVIIHTNDSATYTVTGTTTDGTNGIVSVDKAITGAASGNIRLASLYSYYFRLNAVDSNGNQIAGAATGLGDYVVPMTAAGVIQHKLLGLPAFDLYDHDTLSLEVYRTNKTGAGTYYKIGTKALSFNAAEGYIAFTDSTDDNLLSDVDAINTALLGTEVSTGLSQPMRAKYVTSVNNKLIYANIQTYSQIDISALSNAGFADVTFSDFSAKEFLLRKDNSDSATTTNMVDRVKAVCYTSSSATVTGITANGSTLVVEVASTSTLAIGDWVYLYRGTALGGATSTNNPIRFAGWHQVAAVTSTTITVKSKFTGTWDSSIDINRVVWDLNGNVPVLLAADYNLSQVGANDDNFYQILVRVANALNASMRQVDITISGFEDFTPWAVVQSGSSIGAGRLVFRQEIVLDTTMELVLPEVTSIDWYAFGELYASGATTTVQGQSLLYPSRLIVSYPGYPEMFELPDQQEAEAPYVVDVNSADGEEITMCMPFFAESAFSSAQVEAVLVVFKENSIYLVNVDSGQIQKIQSRGIGCTAPYSVATTKDGINFANNSGIYRLNRNLTISYVGEYIERIYQDEVDRDLLQNMTATHNSIGSQYKLSYTLNSNAVNSNVFVYDYQREGKEQEMGAWSTFTNHPATGWANLGNNSFFATTNGQVYKIRNNNDETDYRDDADAVDTMQILLRADDFGLGGERKLLRYVTTHFEMRTSDNTGTILSIAYDLQSDFEQSEDFEFTDNSTTKVKFGQSSLPRKKAVYFQLKYVNDQKDEAVILAGVDYTVAKLSTNGVKQGS